MILYIRLSILILSILGYSFFMKEKYGVRLEFGPAVVCAGISTVMFFAGLLNIFVPVVVLLTAGGIVLLFHTMVKTRLGLFRDVRSIALCTVWLAALAYLGILVSGSHFVGYDNFSHWAAVVKAMLLNDRMPNFQDSVIIFQAYPLGSSVFIYYVCKVIGDTDACQIFGQLLMLVSFLLPLTVFIKRKNAWAGAAILLFSVTALVCNIPIYDLLVDTLMPLAALALFCIIEYELGQGEKQNLIRSAALTVPMSIFLLQVKNSGIFFCLVAWAYFIIKQRHVQLTREERFRFTCRFAGLGILLPLVTEYLWERHVALVYSAGESSKHAMSIKNYENILGEKTPADIKNIAGQIVAKLLDVQNVSFLIMAIITVMMLVLILLALQAKDRTGAVSLAKRLGSIYLIYALYVLSVFAMYIFSMPIREALILASYDRYMLSVDLLCLGIAVSYALNAPYAKREKVVALILTVCMALTVLPFRASLPTLVKKQEYTSTLRYDFQQLMQGLDAPSDSVYLLYCAGSKAGYLYYMSCYELWSVDIALATEKNLDKFLPKLQLYDYIIITTPDENSQQFLQNAGLGEYATGQPCVIDLSSTNA